MNRLFQFHIEIYDDKKYEEDGILAAESYADAVAHLADYYDEDHIVGVEITEIERLVLLEDLRPLGRTGE